MGCRRLEREADWFCIGCVDIISCLRFGFWPQRSCGEDGKSGNICFPTF